VWADGNHVGEALAEVDAVLLAQYRPAVRVAVSRWRWSWLGLSPRGDGV